MYHINEKGEPGHCRATEKCPFEDDKHFLTSDLARKDFEARAEAMADKLAEQKISLASIEEKLEALEKSHGKAAEALRKGKGTADDLRDLRQAVKDGVDELREAVNEHRLMQHKALRYGVGDIGFFDKVYNTKYMIRSNKLTTALFRNRRNFTMPMSAGTYRGLIAELTAWSGLPRDEVKKLLRKESQPRGVERDAYVTSLFQSHREETRDRVFVDLETTSFSPSTGEIVEIGLIRVNPAGEVIAEINERFDIDPRVRDTLGLGAEAIHGITADAVRGLPRFTDPEVQARIAAHLNDGSVMVAHNTPFEDEWFSHYLDGYHEAHSADSADNIVLKREPQRTQDTRKLAMFLGHGMANTRLETFATSNGIPYEDAHSAYPDAFMTWKAFEAFEKKIVAASLGQRPTFGA